MSLVRNFPMSSRGPMLRSGFKMLRHVSLSLWLLLCGYAAWGQEKSPAKPPTITTPNILDRDFWVNLGRHFTENALSSALQICGILLLYVLLRALLHKTIDSVLSGIMAHEARAGVPEDRTRRLQTLSGLFKSVIGYGMFFIFGILLFKAVGFDVMPFITTAGVIGLAIGFGAQKLVKDVISGFFLIVDNMFVVGEVVTIGTVTGQVQDMGMRVTRLVDSGGRIIMISNGDIGIVTNLSRNPVQDFVEVNVAGATDVNTLTETLNKAGQSLFAANDHKLHAPPQMLGLTAISAAAITARVSVVSDPHDLLTEQMRVRVALRAALLAAEIPLA